MKKTEFIITINDNSSYSLKENECLKNVDAYRKVLLFFDNGQTYKGFTDGEVDEGGDLCLSDTQGGLGFGIALPFDRLVGWSYEDERKTIITQLEESFNELGRTKKAEFISKHIELATANAVAKYVKPYLFDVLKDVDNDDYVADYLKQRGYKVTKI